MTGYGRDSFCTDSLRTGRLVTGITLLGQAAYRRLTTPRGTLRGGEDEENYGLDLSEMLGDDAELFRVSGPGQIRAELLKDSRFADVQATVTLVDNGDSTYNAIVGVTIQPHDEGDAFELVLNISEVTVELLKLKAVSGVP